MAATVLKAGAFASLCAIFVALYVRKHLDEILKDKLTSVLQGLVEVEKNYSVVTAPRVAVGYGACHDVFINAEEILEFEDVANSPEHYGYIKNIEELLKSYAYFFRHGAAAERYVDNDTLFFHLVHKATYIRGVRNALGGNAAVMATRFLEEGCDVILGAFISTPLAERLPKQIRAIRTTLMEKDDVHLILEYKAGEEWGPYVSPRANRFIIHSDRINPKMEVVEMFAPQVKKFYPNLFVVGGLQVMDNFPFKQGVRLQRLESIKSQMLALSEQTRVHFEMASFTDEELVNELTENIIPFADSMGMNEQELANLYSVLSFSNISLVADSNPRVAVVLDQMRAVFLATRELAQNTARGRPLTRLHVHTLAYQAILTVAGSPWKNSAAAAAKASLTANRHVCGSKQVDVEKAVLIMDESFSTSSKAGARRVPLDVKAPVSCWEETWRGGMKVHICVAPVLVCTEAHQTAGGGDNISSAGLVLQI